MQACQPASHCYVPRHADSWGRPSTCSRYQHDSSRSAADWRIEHQQALRPDLKCLVHVLPLLAWAHLKTHTHRDAEALFLATLMQLHLVVSHPQCNV